MHTYICLKRFILLTKTDEVFVSDENEMTKTTTFIDKTQTPKH